MGDMSTEGLNSSTLSLISTLSI